MADPIVSTPRLEAAIRMPEVLRYAAFGIPAGSDTGIRVSGTAVAIP